MDLNVLVNNSLKKIQEEGKIQEIVDKRIEKTIESIIDDLFNDWSDFSKNLKSEVEKKLNINLKELDIAGYNTLVLAVVKEKLDKVITNQGISKINESLDKMLADVKEEYSLSEIIEELKECEGGYKDHDDRLTLIIEKDPGYFDRIYIDEYEDQSKRDCKYCITVNEKTGKIFNVKMDGSEIDKEKIMGGFYGLEEMLFKIYATGAKIIFDLGLDPDDYGLDYHVED